MATPRKATAATIARETATQRDALKAEAADVTVGSVKWGGREWTFPLSLQGCDIDILEAFEVGKIIIGLRGILGPQQWKAFKGRNPKPTGLDTAEFFGLIAAELGLELGE